MSKSFDDTNPSASTVKATRAQGERKYPVEPREARDVAVRRILYRDDRRPAPNPCEYQIWLEFIQFPEVLGRYQPPPGYSIADTHDFIERWVKQIEASDSRLYCKVRTDTQAQISALRGMLW